MTQGITIAILDSDRYFAQGLEAVLYNYFTQKGMLVRFLSEQHATKASLLFRNSNMNCSTQFCQRYSPLQQIIIIQDIPCYHHRRMPPCLRAFAVIDRCISIQALLQVVERGLILPRSIIPVRKCHRGIQTLTLKERQVLSILRHGLRNNQVARLMALTPKTVSTHKRNAMSKLGFTRNAELYHWLQNGGLNNPPLYPEN